MDKDFQHYIEYTTWLNIKSRCYNINSDDYKNYGERGIKICYRWLNSFKNFYEDMGDRPSKKHSINRIDNDKDYSPENCEWVTRKIHNRNYRRNHIIEYNGKKQTLVEWSEELNINYNMLKNRINNLGWSIEESFTEKKCIRQLEYNGEIHTALEWSKILNIKKNLINDRLSKGWSIDKTLSKIDKKFKYD